MRVFTVIYLETRKAFISVSDLIQGKPNPSLIKQFSPPNLEREFAKSNHLEHQPPLNKGQLNILENVCEKG